MTSAVPISVVIPTYNRVRVAGRCIDSVLAQTHQDFELIITDNASTDGTWEVIQQYAAKDTRIRVFRNPRNLGPVENWRRGVELACGRYCKILFSDDSLEPRYLELAAAPLADPEIGFSFSAAFIESCRNRSKYVAYRRSRTCETRPSGEFIRKGLLGLDVPVSPSAALFRTVDIKQHLTMSIPSPTFSDWQQHGAGVDQLLFLRTARQYPFVFHVASPQITFGNGGDTITGRMAGYAAASRYLQARICFAHQYGYTAELRALLARAWYVELVLGRSVCSPREACLKYLDNPPFVSPLRAGTALIRGAGKAALHRMQVGSRTLTAGKALQTQDRSAA